MLYICPLHFPRCLCQPATMGTTRLAQAVLGDKWDPDAWIGNPPSPIKSQPPHILLAGLLGKMYGSNIPIIGHLPLSIPNQQVRDWCIIKLSAAQLPSSGSALAHSQVPTNFSNRKKKKKTLSLYCLMISPLGEPSQTGQGWFSSSSSPLPSPISSWTAWNFHFDNDGMGNCHLFCTQLYFHNLNDSRLLSGSVNLSMLPCLPLFQLYLRGRLLETLFFFPSSSTRPQKCRISFQYNMKW